MIIIDGRAITKQGAGISNYAKQVITQLNARLSTEERIVILLKRGNYLNTKFAEIQLPFYNKFSNIFLNSWIFTSILKLVLSEKTLKFYSVDLYSPKGNFDRKIITIHDVACLEHESYHPVYTPPQNYLRAIRNATDVICISEFTKSELERFDLIGKDIATHNVHVVRTGIEDMVLQDNTALAKKDYILFVGTFEPRKNLENLINGFYASSYARNGGTLILLGRFGWNEELNNFIRNSDDNILIVEGASEQEKWRYIRAAKFLIYVSKYEGYGLPIAEALSANIPVICSDIPVFRELFDGFAAFCDASSSLEIAVAIDHMCDNGANAFSAEGLFDKLSWDSGMDKITGLLS